LGIQVVTACPDLDHPSYLYPESLDLNRLDPSYLCPENLDRLCPSCLYSENLGRLCPENLASFHPFLFDSTGINLNIENVGPFGQYL
jgi:hypothetical protein